MRLKVYKTLIRLKRGLSTLPLPLYVCIGVLCLFSVSAFFYLIMSDVPEMPKEVDENAFSFIILATIHAPLIETFVFQLLPIEVSQYVLREKYKRRSVPISIVISATLFSLVHSQSVLYILWAFGAGIVFALLYYIKSGKGFAKPFIATWVIHLIWNLLSILID